MNKYKEHIINSEEIYRGKLLTLEVNTVELPNKSYSKREIVKHDGSAGVVAITENQEIILVKQYRAATGSFVVEIPAGIIEVGEEPLDTARRELYEETGYSSDEMEHFLDFYVSPGYSTEIIHLFITRDISLANKDDNVNEDIEIIKEPIKSAYNMIRNGNIMDSKTIIAIQHLYYTMV